MFGNIVAPFARRWLLVVRHRNERLRVQREL